MAQLIMGKFWGTWRSKDDQIGQSTYLRKKLDFTGLGFVFIAGVIPQTITDARQIQLALKVTSSGVVATVQAYAKINAQGQCAREELRHCFQAR